MHTKEEERRKLGDSEIELKVAAGSQAQKVAGAIVKYMEEGYDVSLLAIGAGATNQAVKGICIARGMVATKGWNLYTVPGLVDEWVVGERKTAVRFIVRK